MWGLDLSGQNGNAPPWPGGVSESPAGLHGAGGIPATAQTAQRLGRGTWTPATAERPRRGPWTPATTACQGQVGGLLAMTDTKSTSTEADDAYMIYFYDANGNVGQVIDARAGSTYYGQAVARYEYYPFGGVLTSAIIKGSSGSKNPFLFSTKYRDSETGLYYYGYRYLLPRLGRWLNRDPIGERGGLNLCEVIRNNPVGKIDPHGLCSEFSCGGPPTSGPSDDEEYVTAKPPAGSEPGRFWPVCCKFLYDICMHDCPLLGKKGYRKCPKELQGKNCADICEKAKKDCLAATMENPCHAGRWLDYYCRFIEGAKGDDVCTPKRTRPHSFNQFRPCCKT